MKQYNVSIRVEITSTERMLNERLIIHDDVMVQDMGFDKMATMLKAISETIKGVLNATK